MRKNNLVFLSLIMVTMVISLACNSGTLTRLINPGSESSEPPNPVSPANQAPLATNSIKPPTAVGSPVEKAPTATNSIKPLTAVGSPVGQQQTAGVFTETDCSMSGIIFNPISIDYMDYDPYAGPYLACSYSATGAYGLDETVYLQISTFKADQLDQFYQDVKENISGHVAQSNEWNAHPDLPADAKDVISMIRDDGDGYVFMITKNASVQGCSLGKGFGVEKINGKYLAQYVFSSCASTSDAYITSLNYMRDIAQNAIARVEASAQP